AGQIEAAGAGCLRLLLRAEEPAHRQRTVAAREPLEQRADVASDLRRAPRVGRVDAHQERLLAAPHRQDVRADEEGELAADVVEVVRDVRSLALQLQPAPAGRVLQGLAGGCCVCRIRSARDATVVHFTNLWSSRRTPKRSSSESNRLSAWTDSIPNCW